MSTTPQPARQQISTYQDTNVVLASQTTRPLWFDGRFLAARDLQRDQNYFLEREAKYGQSAGFGVIHGLQVDTLSTDGQAADAETIVIRAGQGLTPGGDLVMISTDLTIRISDLTTEENLEVQFGISSQPSDLARTRTGLFVVALRPLEFTANQITSYPVSIQGTRTTRDGDIVEATGVSLVRYPDPPGNYDSTSRQAAVARQIFVLQDFGTVSDSLLPLAMISIQRGSIEWVDTWMVRRDAGPESSGLLFGLPDPVTQQAFLLQYNAILQNAVAPFTAQNIPARFPATDYVQALPACGPIPLGCINTDDFTQLFFPQQTIVQLRLVAEDELPALIEDSFSLPPIDLTLPASAYADLSVFVLVPVRRPNFDAVNATVTPMPLTGALPTLSSTPRPLALLNFFRFGPLPPTGTSPESAAWKKAIGSLTFGYYARRRSTPTYTNLNKAATFTLLTLSFPGVKLTATVSPTAANGTVTFNDGANTLGTATLSGGSAVLVATLAVGAHTLTAVYQGDDNFAASTSAAVTQVIDPA
ncbi:MAG TPA: Ig-like domain-containing protein [Bryobacteraceae bacterium]|nr:Ig-like domain-containing protein [Bryobacteraceae bacterium]